jgi:hypothetical protein
MTLEALIPSKARTGIAAPRLTASPSAARSRGGVLVMNKSVVIAADLGELTAPISGD